MITNTAPFDITHHPAMSLPCGMVDGLPVGLMLVGRTSTKSTIYRAAHAFEQVGDWKKMYGSMALQSIRVAMHG